MSQETTSGNGRVRGQIGIKERRIMAYPNNIQESEKAVGARQDQLKNLGPPPSSSIFLSPPSLKPRIRSVEIRRTVPHSSPLRAQGKLFFLLKDFLPKK